MLRPLTLVAVGDLQLGDSPTSIGYGFYSRYRGTPLDRLFSEIQPAVAEADILFGNLESTLVPPMPGETHRGALQLRGEAEFAIALRRVGFNVLNVANNHASQHGNDTFHATIAAVRAAGIACCGVRGSTPWACEPALLHQGEVGFLGYCRRPRQYSSGVPPYAEGSLDEIRNDVHRLRASGVTVVVSLHWGEEFVPQPSEEEIAFGHTIIDAGAALIVGHHPHVIRPVERYKSGLVAYSLGNFIGDMVWYKPFRRGAVLRCTLTDGAVVDASTIATTLADDYRPLLAPEPAVQPLAEGQVRGLDAAAYSHAIANTMYRQRMASYKAAMLNLRRTPLPILAQLATQTIRNKVAAVAERVARLAGGKAR